MRSLSASELLAVWERASSEHPIDRALTLLSACSEESRLDLAQLSIGRRDARLLGIYRQLFGPAMEAFAQCPQCGERLEYSLPIQELKKAEGEKPQLLLLQSDDRCFQLRLPDSLDLRAASECSDSQTAQKILLERCVVEPALQVEDLSESTVEKIASCLAQADAQAETLIDLTCCACRHSWQVIFDIQEFLWVKVSALAKRLLREVNALARAYGWREHDILALSAVRRQAYLEMAGSWLTF